MEQLKVMLVDDEPIVIEDLLSIIDWKENGFQVVGTACSAMAALKLMRQQSADVVFMDVSMPSMDGLELSARLKEINPSVTILILSGYMDFGYAQRAMSLGIQSYLVKHQLTAEVLVEELKKVRESIRKKRRDSNLLRSQIIQCILGDEVYFEKLLPEEAVHLKDYESPFLFFLITPVLPCLDQGQEAAPIHFHASAIHQQLEYSEKTDSSKTMQTGTAEQAANITDTKLLDILVMQGNLLVTVQPKSFPGKAALFEELHRIWNCIEKTLDTKMFAVCFAHSTRLADFYYDYHLLKRYCGQYIFSGRTSLMIVENTRTYTSQTGNPEFLNEHAFLNDYEEMYESLKQAFHRSVLTKNKRAFGQYCEGVLALIRKMDPQYEFRSRELFSSSDAKTVGDLLLQELDNVHRESSAREKYSPISNYVIRYINANYHLNPTLNEIAAQMNSNSMYVGQKFRKDTGMSFNEYLTDRRVRYAKSLLINTNMKMAEIAQKSGFSGSQYFSRIFKDQTGMTPLEYRQRFMEV